MIDTVALVIPACPCLYTNSCRLLALTWHIKFAECELVRTDQVRPSRQADVGVSTDLLQICDAEYKAYGVQNV